MEKNVVEEKKVKKLPSIDLNKIIEKARSHFGKDFASAMQISTGSSISRLDKDSDFILWPNSFWESLTTLKGLPFGRVSQISGRPNSGKTSMAMVWAKLAQDQGILVIVWDSERKFSPNRFDNYFKGDSSKLLVVNSNMILTGGNQIEKLVHSIFEINPDQKVLIIWDSVGASLAQNESQDSLDSSKQLAAASKENGSVIRAFTRLMEKYKNREKNQEMISLLLINQVYSAIGSVGNIESGGSKIEYSSSLILQLTRRKDLTKVKGGVKIKTGIVSVARVKKNHMFDSEYCVAELDIAITAGSIDLLSSKKVVSEDDDQIIADEE